MGIFDSLYGLFERGRQQEAPVANVDVQQTQNTAVAANMPEASLTFNGDNITFAGGLRAYDYNRILRDKQAHIYDLYALSDYYIDADPIYRGIIKEVYAPFATVDEYKLVGANEEVKRKYMDYYKRIHLKDKMESIFYQFFKYGNVFVYLMPDGRIITLPPHMIRIGNIQVNGEPIMEFHCSKILSDYKQTSGKSPTSVIDDVDLMVRLQGFPEEVRDGVIAGQDWVQLRPENAYALQDVKEDWMRYAIPLIASCLRALQKKDVISNWENAVLNLGMRSFLHVKYGDPTEHVAPNIDQLNAVHTVFRQAMSGSALAVTNSWADAKFLQPDLDELFSDDKYSGVNADILSAGGVSGIIVSGRAEDGSTYATAQVSMQTVAIRIKRARENFAEMMNKINHRINEPGFRGMPHSAPDQIPEFTFPPVDLAGTKQFQEICYKLWKDGVVSKKTMLQSYGFDIDQEIERRKTERDDGTDEVLRDPTMVDYNTYDNVDTVNGVPAGMEEYHRNGKVFYRRKRNYRRDYDDDDTVEVGRPTLDDSERHSDPYASVVGRIPKPSNPEGSEAQT